MAEPSGPNPDFGDERAAPSAALAGALLVFIVIFVAARPEPASHSPDLEYRIPVQAATAAELELLPGMGGPSSRSFVLRRPDVGELKAPEDLLRIRGIGPVTVERLAPYIRFDLD